MTMLETQRTEALRQRFGWLAEQACRTTEEKDGEPAPRKKGAMPERKTIRESNDTLYLLTMWSLVNCQMSHLHLN